METTGPGDATALAEAAGDRLVIAVGGDGTAHEVVNGLLSGHTTSPRVGFLQKGTGADLRRSIAAPRRPEDVPAWLTHDQWRPVDAGVLSTSSDRRFFINVADVGIGAEVVRRAAHGPRRAGGTVNFLSAAIVSLLVHRNASIRIRLDEGPWLTRRIRTVAIANGAYLGGAMFMAPRAKVDDGLFEVITVGDIGRLKGILSLPLLYRGTHERLAEVDFAHARQVQIESDQPVGIEADGELAGTTPVTFTILPKALQVIDWPPSGILSRDRAGPAGPRE